MHSFLGLLRLLGMCAATAALLPLAPVVSLARALGRERLALVRPGHIGDSFVRAHG